MNLRKIAPLIAALSLALPSLALAQHVGWDGHDRHPTPRIERAPAAPSGRGYGRPAPPPYRPPGYGAPTYAPRGYGGQGYGGQGYDAPTYDGYGRGDRYDEGPSPAYGRSYYVPAPRYAPPPGEGRWRRGEVLPPSYRALAIADYGRFHLRRPPRGYYWCRNGDEFLLVAAASGLIFDVISGD